MSYIENKSQKFKTGVLLLSLTSFMFGCSAEILLDGGLQSSEQSQESQVSSSSLLEASSFELSSSVELDTVYENELSSFGDSVVMSSSENISSEVSAADESSSSVADSLLMLSSSMMSSDQELSSAVATRGLIAYWPFNGNSTNEVAGVVAGTEEGSVEYTAGAVGQALTLNSYDERVTTPVASADFKLQEFTVSAWFKLDRLNDNQEIYNLHDSRPGVRRGVSVFVGSDNRPRFAMATNNGGVWSEIISNTRIESGLWYFIACSYDGSVQKMIINGNNVEERVENSAILYSDVPPTIGASRSEYIATARYFGGSIDEVKVYNYAVAPEFVMSEYSAVDIDALNRVEKLIAHWSFNGNSNNEVAGVVAGTEEGSVEYASGVIGEALKLDSYNERVTTPVASADFKLQEFTVSAWFKLDRLNDNQEIYNLHDSRPGVRRGVSVFVGSDNRPRFAMATNNGGVWSEVISNARVESGRWYFIACTYDGASQKMVIDGTNVTERNESSEILYSDVPPTIGASRSEYIATSRYFGGSIDEVKVYNYARSLDALDEEYAATIYAQSVVETVVCGSGNCADTRIITNGTLENTEHIGRNDGEYPVLTLGSYDASQRHRVLIQFDIPNAVSATIVSAELVLYRQQTYVKHFTEDFTIDAHTMLKSWNEGSSQLATDGFDNSIFDGATGLEAKYGEPWNAEAVAFDGVDATENILSETVIPEGEMDSFGSVSIDVTDAVRKWVSGELDNNGVILRNEYDVSNDGSYPTFPAFHSSEAANSQLRPKVIVRYIRD